MNKVTAHAQMHFGMQTGGNLFSFFFFLLSFDKALHVGYHCTCLLVDEPADVWEVPEVVVVVVFVFSFRH